METQVILINPDPDRILDALAEVWKLHLERETGRKVDVTWRKIDEHGSGDATGD